MSLVLNLSPELARELNARTEREGVSPSEPARSLITFELVQRKSREEMEAEVAARFAATGATEDELEEYINEAVKQVRAEMRIQDELGRAI